MFWYHRLNVHACVRVCVCASHQNRILRLSENPFCIFMSHSIASRFSKIFSLFIYEMNTMEMFEWIYCLVLTVGQVRAKRECFMKINEVMALKWVCKCAWELTKQTERKPSKLDVSERKRQTIVNNAKIFNEQLKCIFYLVTTFQKAIFVVSSTFAPPALYQKTKWASVKYFILRLNDDENASM